MMQFNSAIKSKWALTTWLFLRGLGFVYCFAFLSLSVQIIALFGKNGILPAADFLHLVEIHTGAERFFLLPTLFWLGASDQALIFVCVLGVLISILAILGICAGFDFLCLWILYLSLAGIGQDFLSFQWDALLLETGFIAIFLAPWQIFSWPWLINAGKFQFKPSLYEPARIIVWLARWLLFRLMLESGLVKLASGDTTWRNLTALNFHYFSQPLPTPIAWYAAQLPVWFNEFSVLFVFFVELIVPFLILMGRKPRMFAAFAIILLQVLIAITGNYAYFNLLTIVLCLLLFDDDFIRRLLSKIFACASQHKELLRLNSLALREQNKSAKIVINGAAILILSISIGSLGRGFAGLLPVPLFLEQWHRFMSPCFIANTYGLFAVMTIERPEIIVEGSNDRVNWQEYEFKYKPGKLSQALPIVAPHQPRLDWQMWFAALGDPAYEPWFVNFMVRLLQGQKAVLHLLAKNPFPHKPPQYVRAVLYDYKFTDWIERKETGNWWKREYKRECLPAISLKGVAAP